MDTHTASDERSVRPADADRINDLLNDAISQWIEICDIDLSDTSFAWSSDGPFSNANLVNIGHAISMARDMDPTGLTSFMMLRGVWEAYLKAFKFSAWDLIMDRGVVEDLVARMTALREVLEDPSVVVLIEEFENKLRDVAKLHGVTDLTKLEELLTDKWTLAYIRRDALLALDALEAHQFCQGEPEADELGYNENILEFWNVNSLLRMMRSQQKPGTTVCLIRDPEELWSYFVFAIVNGPNLTVLTDREGRAHPDQKYMSRSRAQTRRFVARAQRYWFPYDLLKLELSADQKSLYAQARTALVPINAEAVKLCKLKDLEPEELVWLTLMFDLISKRYGEDAANAKLPALSYTGEMVVSPESLVSEGSALVREGRYAPLVLDPLTSEGVNSPEAKAQYHSRGSDRVLSSGYNDWMIERYGDKVPDDLLELVGASSAHRQLTDKASDIARKDAKNPSYELRLGSDSVSLQVRPGRAGIGFMEPTDFGPKESIARDRAWYGRKNSMVVIQRLAMAEHAREKDQILAWYDERVHARLEWFITQAARGELVLPTVTAGSWARELTVGEANGLSQWESRAWHTGSWSGWRSRQVCLSLEGERPCAEKCPVTGAFATIHTQIRPDCPEALAKVCGCTVDELPWALQHWYKNEPYTGNSILDRVDPADWVLKNPWRDHSMTIGLSLSKTAIHRRRKLMGLPRQTWTPEEED